MTYQAITTKYLGPTNQRGARIVARAFAGKVTVPWDYSENVMANHAAAAKALAEKYQWTGGRWHGGGLPDDTGYCFVHELPGSIAFTVDANG